MYYEEADIRKIFERNAGLLGVSITPDAVSLLAGASRATPRVANRLLKRSRDFAQVSGSQSIDHSVALATLDLLEVDHKGLEPSDRRLLQAIIEKFHGGPVGVNTLAASLNEDRGVIEDIYEPYLMTIGFLQRTPAGRIALPAAYTHFGLSHAAELPL
jgi:Holliday junction DNA helicase RuvB